mmetsp:Transcript_93540/g.260458  ORF Transcript_93540/g.260458 Transcript_93540/m.260458 type:complete len:210 (+) Transcript_93540:571-1200(+)
MPSSRTPRQRTSLPSALSSGARRPRCRPGPHPPPALWSSAPSRTTWKTTLMGRPSMTTAGPHPWWMVSAPRGSGSANKRPASSRAPPRAHCAAAWLWPRFWQSGREPWDSCLRRRQPATRCSSHWHASALATTSKQASPRPFSLSSPTCASPLRPPRSTASSCAPSRAWGTMLSTSADHHEKGQRQLPITRARGALSVQVQLWWGRFWC